MMNPLLIRVSLVFLSDCEPFRRRNALAYLPCTLTNFYVYRTGTHFGDEINQLRTVITARPEGDSPQEIWAGDRSLTVGSLRAFSGSRSQANQCPR